MKSVLLVVFALCVSCFAYPRPENVVTKVDEDDSVDSDTEFVRVPLEHDQPRRTFGFGLGFPEFAPSPPFEQDPFFRSSPFGGIGGIRPHGADGDQVDDFMTQMQEMLREMRKQLTALVHHAHRDHGIGEDDGSVGTRIGGDDDLPKNQTTSTTKVIDGHVVTVNETTYTSGDDNIGAVFRIKVVEVVPSESPESEAGEGEDGESKPEEPSSEAPGTENETINNNKSELEEDGHETNEIPNHSAKVQYEWSSELDPSLNEIEQPEDDSVEQFTPVKKQLYHDLSQDTNVNDYLSDQAQSQGLVMIDPDAEFVNADANAYYRYETEPERVQRVNV